MNHSPQQANPPRMKRACGLGSPAAPVNQLATTEAAMAKSNDMIMLNAKQIAQFQTAIRLARTCLMCSEVGESLKEEAIKEMRIVQETFDRRRSAR